MNPSEELEIFLKKIDDIGNVVNGLNSNDPEIVEKNLSRADKLLNKDKNVIDEDGIITRTGENRSCINKYSDGDKNRANTNLNQEEFMRIMEQDAEERYKRKLENRKIANDLKEKGNVEFKQGNLDKAVEFYTEALKIARDLTPIYTNRAQVFIKQGKYKEAIEDCNWALRVDEKCVKAMIHKGKALTYLKDFDKALEEFENVKKTDSKQSEVANEYIKEMERCRQTDNQEKAAKLFLNEADATNSNLSTENFIHTLKNLIEKINKEGQNVLYYSGGLRALSVLFTDVTRKTLFRTEIGFDFFEKHSTISKYLHYADKLNKLKPTELDFLLSIFEFKRNICIHCDENINCLFKIEKYSDCILKYLTPDSTENDFNIHLISLRVEILNILLKLSESEFGSLQLINNFDLQTLIKAFVKLIQLESNEAARKDCLTMKISALQILQNLAIEKRFCDKIKNDQVEALTEEYSKILQVKDLSINAKCISLNTINALMSKKVFLLSFSKNVNLFEHLIHLFDINMKSNELDTLLNIVLCVLLNISSLKNNSLIDAYSAKIMENILGLIESDTRLVLGVVGNMLQNCLNKKEILHQISKDYLLQIVNFIKENKNIDQSIKVLALCTQLNSNYRNLLIEIDDSLCFLYNLFENVSQSTVDTEKINLKKLNEVAINNATICLSNCVEGSKKLARNLCKFNIIMDLLYLTRDGRNVEMQKNCGILIAKLCKQEEKHLIRLRELHGIEILHSALRNANI